MSHKKLAAWAAQWQISMAPEEFLPRHCVAYPNSDNPQAVGFLRSSSLCKRDLESKWN